MSRIESRVKEMIARLTQWCNSSDRNAKAAELRREATARALRAVSRAQDFRESERGQRAASKLNDLRTSQPAKRAEAALNDLRASDAARMSASRRAERAVSW